MQAITLLHATSKKLYGASNKKLYSMQHIESYYEIIILLLLEL